VVAGESVATSFANSVELARAAERHGYERVWYAEHHNAPSIASSATSVLIGHVAGKTSTIRLGAGGVMLPNHPPLVIAEQFGTLATLYPGRIDLGVGRAPGTDQMTMRAMRRSPASAESFPDDVLELQGYLRGKSLVPGVQATPGSGTDVPLFVLGSSMFGARLAAAYGLPYAFASHFSPGMLHEAVAAYRRDFVPSDQLSAPYVIAGVNVVAASSSDEAEQQFEQARRRLVRSLISRSPGSPNYTDEQIGEFMTTRNGRQLASMLSVAAVGDPAQVSSYLTTFAEQSHADELILVHQAGDLESRLTSVALTADAALVAPV
jgi:luciferase family oxidoreductase group 1